MTKVYSKVDSKPASVDSKLTPTEKQRDKIYQILKLNNAINKASWWNIASEIVDEWLLKEITATDLKWKKRIEGIKLDLLDKTLGNFEVNGEKVETITIDKEEFINIWNSALKSLLTKEKHD